MCNPISSRAYATTSLSAGIGLPTFRSHSPYLLPKQRESANELDTHKLLAHVHNSQDREKIDCVVL
eukprot:COSAG02_NODE_4477_length_5322_cov_8.823090_3_plen_66_part_00